MTPFKTQNRVTSPFGWRTIFDKREFHRGVDIVPTTRSGEMLPESAWLIREVTGGMVLRTAADQWRGNYVDVQTAPGTFERYQHLARADVGVGQAVAQGTVIGLAGSTGQSTGRHLHFGVYRGGTAERCAVMPSAWAGLPNACGLFSGNDTLDAANMLQKPATLAAPQDGDNVWLRVTAQGLHLRAVPQAENDGTILTTLPYGLRLRRWAVRGAWVCVSSEVGSGWVHGDYVAPEDT